MLIGEFQHSLDAKNRLIVPAKFRDDLGQSFVITRGLDICLFAYPMEEWGSIEKKLRGLPFTKASDRAFVRMFFSGATECELDKQGRILIPEHLKSHARIDKDTVIIGLSSRVEIWGREVWDGYRDNADISYEELAERIDELDLSI